MFILWLFNNFRYSTALGKLKSKWWNESETYTLYSGADGSDEEGCIEKSCCDRVHVDGLTFIRQEDRLMNGRPFYELEGAGEDVYLYYYHDGKKNRYWLISKYVSRVFRIDCEFML